MWPSKVHPNYLQLFARLQKRPRLVNLHSLLLPAPVMEDRSIVEIHGGTGSGKSVLMTHLIAQCILDVDCGGCGGSAVFIDLDHKFDIDRLHRVLSCALKGKRAYEDVHGAVHVCLSRLQIHKCFGIGECMTKKKR